MARILYGLMGDSRGHLNRARIVARETPDHEYLFVGGHRAVEIRKSGYDLVEIPLIGTYYKNNQVDFVATIWNFAKRIATRSRVIYKLTGIIQEFDPHLIISDWEYFTPLAAKRLGRECVSFDHQHVVSECVYESPPNQRLNRLSLLFTERLLYHNASKYLIVSFFDPPTKDPRTTEILPPLIRREVMDHKPTDGSHVLVYQTSSEFGALAPMLEGMDEKFVIYGAKGQTSRKNLTFKPPSDDGFLSDLSSSRYCIVNGGHNVICEALYFGKPVFCFPIAFAFEQTLNAHFVREMGFGDYALDIGKSWDAIQSFTRRLNVFREHIARYDFFGNQAVRSKLEGLINGAEPLAGKSGGAR